MNLLFQSFTNVMVIMKNDSVKLISAELCAVKNIRRFYGKITGN